MYSVIVNAVVFKDAQVLISQRSLEEKHMPGAWTIPGGKVENTEEVEFEVLEKNLKKEVKEETGVEIAEKMIMVTNNTFKRTNGDIVLALVFKCIYSSGTAEALEDTIDCRWIRKEELDNFEFAPNVQFYIEQAYLHSEE